MVPVMEKRRLAAIAAGAGLLYATGGLAAGLVGMESGDLRISTDATDYNIATGDFTMPHHVNASRPGTIIDGDRAHGNGKAKTVILEGHVVIHNSGDGGGTISSLGASDSREPSVLMTDKLTIELTPKTYTADGHVHFVQGGRVATADRAVLNDHTHDLHLMGNVHLEDTGQSLDAATLDYNTASEHVHANDNVRIVVPLASPEPGAAATAGPAPRAHRRR